MEFWWLWLWYCVVVLFFKNKNGTKTTYEKEYTKEHISIKGSFKKRLLVMKMWTKIKDNKSMEKNCLRNNLDSKLMVKTFKAITVIL